MLNTSQVYAFETEPAIQPRYIASCYGGGKHRMRPTGIAMIYNGTAKNPGTLNYRGTASTCDFCDIILCSQYYPGVIIRCLGKYNVAFGAYTGSQIYVGFGGSDGVYNSLTADDWIKGFELYN